MNHEMMKEKLQAFRDQELGEEGKREVLQHLPLCEECRENFVQNVMARLERLEEPAPARPRLAFLDWLFPVLGYGFAIALMFVAIAHREPLVTAEAVLLADVPQNSHWAFSSEPTGVNKIFE